MGTRIRIKWAAAGILMGFVATVGTAWAEDEQDVEETFSGSALAISVGRFYPEVDTYIRVDGTGGLLGTELKFDTWA